MKIENIDVGEAIEKVEKMMSSDKSCSPVLRTAVQLLIVIVMLLANRLGLNSSNSSKPPSSDPNRKKGARAKSKNNAGGQPGRNGCTLEPIDVPDEVVKIPVDREELPGGKYQSVGHVIRQVFDIRISRYVTEYQAEILENESGKQFTAKFPEDVRRRTQYSQAVKAHACYFSQFQLTPYDRLRTQFSDQFGFPLSVGSIYNFNREAYRLLAPFEDVAKASLKTSELLHADETGINIAGKRKWLHGASNAKWTWLEVHDKRGCEAMDEIGIIPGFTGVLCHDHWKPYFTYKGCVHSLCNAHIQRELTCAFEQDNQQWAGKMKTLLLDINKEVDEADGALEPNRAEVRLGHYRELLRAGDVECPPRIRAQDDKRRGRLKRSKSRNLLERLTDFESEILLFMTLTIAVFTNNQGERDIRMTKVQQKISGCFKSRAGANSFCRIRSYLSTCMKHGVTPTDALRLLFKGEWPEFLEDQIAQLTE